LIFDHYAGFYLNLHTGGITVIALVISGIPDTKLDSEVKALVKSNWAGLVFLLLLALNWGGITYPWNPATIIGPLCAAICVLFIF
jgi:hypothetical protein